MNPFDFTDSVLAESDSMSTAPITFDLSEPTLAYLQVGDQAHQIYLSPGDELAVEVDDDAAGQTLTLTFSGTGSAVNNYFREVAQIEQQFATAGGRDSYELNRQEFFDRLDSTREAYDDFHRRYTDSVAIPETLTEALKVRNRLKMIVLKENYELVYYAEQSENSELQKERGRNFYELPVDVSYLNHPLLAYDYAVALKMYVKLTVHWPLYDSLPAEESFQKDLPITANKIIRDKNYPAEIEAFLLAESLSDFLASGGITPAVDTVFFQFKRNHEASVFTSSLERQYKKWLDIAPGRPAPEIRGTTPEGTPLLLSDLKGKVVYIDVWATWCAPCLKEFPHSKKVQQRFEGNDQVAFLYVSVDRTNDLEKWKKMVADKNLSGVHIIDSPESEANSIWKAYLVSGIPRYILVDQLGKIVNADAARPSSGKVEDEIRRLLDAR